MSLCKQAAAVSGTLRIYTAIIVKDLKPVRISFYLEDQSMAANMGDYNTLANFISWGTSKYKSKPLYAYFIRCRRRIDERYGL